MAAKAQEQQIFVYITGIDMSSAFDTINREEVLRITSEIFDDDEKRILRVLLSATTLEIKVNGADPIPFESNTGSPQGDSISVPIFTVYFESALREVREAVDNVPIDVRDINMKWIEQDQSELPDEMKCADDCDFITKYEKKNETTLKEAYTKLASKILLVNETKTERTEVKRCKKKEDETWRTVKKLGSLFGDTEDMKRRKILATAAMNSNPGIWKRKELTSLQTRLKLYETLVVSILLYNCGTWGMSANDEKNMDSFHRKQLRKVLGISWPHKICNRKLYEKTGTQPLPKTIIERRWKLLGHIMRLPAECPARKTMRYFFENRTCKKFVGRKRTTIVSTLNRDISPFNLTVSLKSNQ